MALSAPASEIDICNLTTVMLRQTAVSQIDPPTTVVESLFKNLYPHYRRHTLRLHPWNFAIKRQVLLPEATAPAFGFQLQYALPADFIRYLRREDTEGYRLNDDEYQIEGGKFLINGSSGSALRLVYIYDAQDVSKFDSLFVSLLATNLAVAIAPSMERNESRIKVLMEQQQVLMSQALSIDGQERPPKRIEESQWMARRRQGSRGLVASKYIRFS